jgi:4-amino-4-deoxy-L-arabinose transferase-like glycosyltransferase
MLQSEKRLTPSGRGFAAEGAHATLWNVVLACLVLFAASLLIRLIDVDGPPIFDELYTLLAAKGWLASGEPRIADGLYDRAQLFTVLVAGFFHWFGESLVVARMPSLIAGSLLVVAVFLWTRSVAGMLVALIAGAFVALSPLAIQVSQFARFYALHALVFWLASVATYRLASRPFRLGPSLLLAAACVLGFAVAAHLQILTLIGLGGVGLWLALVLGLPLVRFLTHRPRLLWTAIAVAVILALLALLVLYVSGLGEALLDRYRYTPAHAAPRRNEVWFYHLQLIERYPTLWPVLPITALIATAAKPRPALFCLSVFLPGFVLLSFAGMKHFKYMFFLCPFLFVIWAITLAEVLGYLRRGLVTVTDAALRQLDLKLDRPPVRWAVIGACLVFLALANGAPARTLLLPFGIQLQPEGAPVDWEAAKDVLQPWFDRASVVLTNEELAALYYFGRFDVTVSRSRLSELDDEHEFSLDNRTGRPVVSTVDSVARIMACYPHGLLLTNTRMWRNPAHIDSQLADFIELHAEPVDVPRALRIVAFAWGQPDIDVPPDACAQLSGLRARPGGRAPAGSNDHAA